MVTAVDWPLLTKALFFYEELGYQYVEVPWVVQRHIMDITARGNPAPEFGPKGGRLIGSGEQGFLALEHNEDTVLSPGKYCTMTPCFRPGDDDPERFHQPYFMKIELFRTDIVDQYAVDEMIWDVSVFIKEELRYEGFHLERVDTPEENFMIPHHDTGTLLSADLNLNGIEVGSYGLRHCPELDWVYGTGLAEPRFSQAHAEYNTFINNNPVLSVV